MLRALRCRSGARPKTRPVSTATASVKSSTGASIAISAVRGMASGLVATSRRRPASASPTPAAAPASERMRALGDELDEQAAAARAERGADRELLLPRLRSREQQVGEVRAGDEQHEPDGALQDPQRRRHVADDVVLERVVPQPVRRGVRHVRVRRDGLPLAQHAVEVVSGLGERHVGLQPANQVERVAAAPAGIGRVDA